VAELQKENIISEELVTKKIYLIRGQNIMLDKDLAELYGVDTKQLKRQVRRNAKRFPVDFFFQLTKEEVSGLRSQIGTSSRGGTRYLPFAFTEQGVAMLSTVLNSERAIMVNIEIIRIFIRMRKLIASNKEILHKLEKIETKLGGYDEDISLIFEQLKRMLNPLQPARKRIGFRRRGEND